jgi:hypothetical protein
MRVPKMMPVLANAAGRPSIPAPMIVFVKLTEEEKILAVGGS